MRHRTWNRLRAAVAGYFWIPCPLCQQPFGGHESCGGWIPSHPGATGGPLICPDCTHAGHGYRYAR